MTDVAKPAPWPEPTPISARKAPMTDLSLREKELVEAATAYKDATQYSVKQVEAHGRLVAALRAYDPPKREYLFPAFNDLSPELRSGIWDSFSGGATHSAGNFWNALREATSKEVKP